MAIEPVLYGLSAALFWGSGDFFSRQPSQRIGYYMTSSLVQLFGFLGLSAYLLLTGGMDSSLMFSHPSYLIINLLVVGVGMFVALLFLYRGYATGIMSIAAPVAGSYPIVTILLSAAILGEIVTGLRAIGILVVIIGIIIAGIKISELRSLSGISKKSDLPTPNEKSLISSGSNAAKQNQSTRIARGLDSALAACLSLGAVYFGLGIIASSFGYILPVMLMGGGRTHSFSALGTSSTQVRAT